ncbi:4-phosphoerythronate dehydrogenase [Alcanivorax sp. JB21]|uniref:4-phosphoerythronate dehydrogenase n=1 Tax=Alcanivorax limicola TaxID=2874102 RepID=UPI001CBE6413|nr:4-phosphoerythronate dehydrogenase [Alcanivorax limicola]MBZ2187522.1 4-phosphoerythronate dehydrogenase [Alcanivorax limicola]
MKIIADENMPALTLFSALGEVTPRAGRGLTQADLRDAQVLLVRSVTRVDEALLADTPVRFVGSATIGTDHVDQAWLARHDIHFAHAPGCNAMAVAEYVLQAVLDWACEQGRALADLQVGIVGVGNAGGRVAALLAAAGCQLRCCDPPRAAAGDTVAGGWASLDEALACDVVTLHVPLSKTGPDATHHLLDATRLARLTRGQLLINSSRGPVIDNAALLARLQADGPEVVLDVWETEPAVPPALFALVRWGTPHIAGYSVEGRTRGSLMVYEALCAHLGQAADAAVLPESPSMQIKAMQIKGGIHGAPDMLALLRQRWDMRDTHAALAAVVAGDEGRAGFDRLRREFPARHEVAGVEIRGEVHGSWASVLTALGATFLPDV